MRALILGVFLCAGLTAQGLEPTAIRVVVTQGEQIIAERTTIIGVRQPDGVVTYLEPWCQRAATDPQGTTLRYTDPTHLVMRQPSSPDRWCVVPLPEVPIGAEYRASMEWLDSAPFPPGIAVQHDTGLGPISEPFAIGLPVPAAPTRVLVP